MYSLDELLQRSTCPICGGNRRLRFLPITRTFIHESCVMRALQEGADAEIWEIAKEMGI